jgi:DNA-directed RNA polymerase alpha subunit
MRLTVHIAEAEKKKVEVPTKKEGTITKTKIFNTLSFEVRNESDVNKILSDIETNQEIGNVTKFYTSNGKIPGRIKVKKK